MQSAPPKEKHSKTCNMGLSVGTLIKNTKDVALENKRDVAHIQRNFIADGYDKEKLNRVLVNAQAYESRKYGGSRGNRNMIQAIKNILNDDSKTL